VRGGGEEGEEPTKTLSNVHHRKIRLHRKQISLGYLSVLVHRFASDTLYSIFFKALVLYREIERLD
jgi:hypothetical protein